jgi:hypothetical protein
MRQSGNIILYLGDRTVLPWDVQRVFGLGHGKELANALGITINDVTLPVTVTIGNKVFTHMLSDELAFGLLLFSFVTNIDFHINIFGAPFTKDYFNVNNEQKKYSRFYVVDEDEDFRDFSVKIGNVTYTFSSPDFMKGFATGALWCGVDHHQYWSELVNYKEDPENEDRVTIPITF